MKLLLKSDSGGDDYNVNRERSSLLSSSATARPYHVCLNYVLLFGSIPILSDVKSIYSKAVIR